MKFNTSFSLDLLVKDMGVVRSKKFLYDISK